MIIAFLFIRKIGVGPISDNVSGNKIRKFVSVTTTYFKRLGKLYKYIIRFCFQEFMEVLYDPDFQTSL